MPWWVVLGRLVMATLFSAIIGFERQYAQKTAGLRTHAMVGLGAAMFTVVSIIGFESGDDARVAAQIVTGVGFLGAGAIFHEGMNVSGLTTAAGLWTAAAIGIAAGTGSYGVAGIGTALALIILLVMGAVTEAVNRRRARAPDQIDIDIDPVKHLPSIRNTLLELDPTIEELSFARTGGSSGRLRIAVDSDRSPMIVEMASSLKGVSAAQLVSPLYWQHRKR